MKPLIVVAGLFSASVLAVSPLASQAPAAMADTPAPDASLSGPMMALEAAWNAGDGLAWGNAFWPDADSINVYGAVIHGSAAIGARHATVFTGRMKGTRMASHLVMTHRLGPDTAVVSLTQTITPPASDGATPAAADGPPAAMAGGKPIRVFATLVTQRRAGNWKILVMQNTSIQPPAEH